MNIFNVVFICFLFFSNTVYARRELIDTTKAAVYGYEVEDIAVITLSDITRPGIDGVVHTLDERIFEKLLWFDGKKHRILPTEDDINRHLDAVKRANDMSDKQLIATFNAGGFTYEEGKEQFGIMYTVNTMIDFKVRGGLFVSRSDVQEYYNQHPEYSEAELLLKQGFVPFDYSMTQQQQFDGIVHAIDNKSIIKGMQWSPPFTVLQTSISEDTRFLLELDVNEISTPLIVRNGFELFQLLGKTERRLKTLDERYGEISELLRRPKYQEILTNYKMQLYDNAAIVYF